MASSAKRKSTPSKKQSKAPPQPQTVYDFWEEQAKKHKGSDLATNPDHNYRKLEIDSIIRVLGQLKHDNILDVGCGNGYTTLQIANMFPDAEITGVDFSPGMIDEALASNVSGNVDYWVGDILSLSRNKALSPGKYDVVLCTRTLINLANWQEQKIGILEMRKMLTPTGRLILVENIKDGLDNLNQIRAKFGLDNMKERWHNKYIHQADIQKFIQDMKGQMTQEYVENIGNMYYLASRVIYAKMCKDMGQEPEYDNPINAIAADLPTLGEYYACSPNFMLILMNGAGPEWVSNRQPS